MTADSSPRPGLPGPRWRACAYGLNLSGDASVLGLSDHGAEPVAGLPDVHLRLAPSLPGGGEARAVVAGAPGRLMIEALSRGGHRMTGPGAGRATIEPDLGRVLIEPPQRDGWTWNRWVLGQVLPFLAALHGYELLHAGGVVVGDEAVAILGPSGRGKSTLVAALVEQGAIFLADDVIALGQAPAAVLAHPGPGVLGVEPPQLLAAAAGRAMGALCVLELGEREEILPVAALPPAELLGNVYERVRRDPGRLAGLLSLLADVSRQTRAIRVRRRPDSDPHTVAHGLLAAIANG